MSKFFGNMILLGILIFALGMFVITFSQANNPSQDLISMGKIARNSGIVVFVIGIIGKIVKK